MIRRLSATSRGQGFTLDPAFPPPVIELTDPKLINTLLSATFKAVEIEKMSQAFSNIHNAFNITNSFNNALDDRSEILEWLSPLEPRVRHRDIGAQRVDSIGAWLLETEEFTHWHNGSREDGTYHPTLFCDGNPGVGKSYIV